MLNANFLVYHVNNVENYPVTLKFTITIKLAQLHVPLMIKLKLQPKMC